MQYFNPITIVSEVIVSGPTVTENFRSKHLFPQIKFN